MSDTFKLDRAKAEVLRRLLDHPPGPLTSPVYTLDQALRDIEEADRSGEDAENEIKANTSKSAPAFPDSTEAYPDPVVKRAADPTLLGTGALTKPTHPERIRAHPSGIPSFYGTATSLWIALDRCITSAKRCMRGRRRTSGMLGMSS